VRNLVALHVRIFDFIPSNVQVYERASRFDKE
jgi:hypothetical protein